MNNKNKLVAAMILIFVVCFALMNRNYDKLARYPYDDAKAKELLASKLNSREISYVVDYEIEPAAFMPYINSPYFNIYNLDTYNKVKMRTIYLSDLDVVRVTEEFLKYTDDFYDFLSNHAWYYCDEMLEAIKEEYK